MRKCFCLSLVLTGVFVFAGCSFLDMIFGGSQPPIGVEEEVSTTPAADESVQPEKASVSDEGVQPEKEKEKEKSMIEDVFKGTWVLQFSVGGDTVTSELFVNTGSFDEDDHYHGVIDTVKSSLYYADSGEIEVTGANPASASYEIDGQNIVITATAGEAYYKGTIKIDQPNPSAGGTGDFLGAECSWTMKKGK
jgi:hypothetical protein